MKLSNLFHKIYAINEQTDGELRQQLEKFAKPGTTINYLSGRVSVDGSIDLYNWNIDKFDVTFTTVSGDFIVPKNIKILHGSPDKVGGSFYLSDNSNVTSLSGGPSQVNGFYIIENCSALETLIGIAKTVGIGVTLFKLPMLDFIDAFPTIKSPNSEINLIECNKITDLGIIGRKNKKIKKIVIDNCANISSLDGLPEQVETLIIKRTPKLNIEEIEKVRNQVKRLISDRLEQ